MFRNRLIADAHFGGETIPGDIGVEVEVEGRNLPTTGRLLREWRMEADHSLRGNSLEYVFRQPLSAEQGFKAIDDLYQAFYNNGTEWEDTTRAGIHVHVNVRHLTEGQVLSFALLFIVFEEALAKFCGEEREGNLFCLKAQDAEYLLYSLRQAACNLNGWRAVASDRLRYAAVNPTSVVRYGSLEFRGMKSPIPKEILKAWCGILLRLREASLQYETPLQIISGVSEAVGGDFAREILGERWADMLETEGGWDDLIKRGMRNVQPVARSFEKAVERYRKQPEEAHQEPAGFGRYGADMQGIRLDELEPAVVPPRPNPEDEERRQEQNRRMEELLAEHRANMERLVRAERARRNE